MSCKKATIQRWDYTHYLNQVTTMTMNYEIMYILTFKKIKAIKKKFGGEVVRSVDAGPWKMYKVTDDVI